MFLPTPSPVHQRLPRLEPGALGVAWRGAVLENYTGWLSEQGAPPCCRPSEECWSLRCRPSLAVCGPSLRPEGGCFSFSITALTSAAKRNHSRNCSQPPSSLALASACTGLLQLARCLEVDLSPTPQVQAEESHPPLLITSPQHRGSSLQPRKFLSVPVTSTQVRSGPAVPHSRKVRAVQG